MTPQEQRDVLLAELGSYRPDLLDRPRLVVGSRADLVPEHDFDGLVVSSVTRVGVPQVLGALTELVREARLNTPEEEAVTIHRPVGSEVSIERLDDGSWNVVGRAALRAVALSDLTNEEAWSSPSSASRSLVSTLRYAGRACSSATPCTSVTSASTMRKTSEPRRRQDRDLVDH